MVLRFVPALGLAVSSTALGVQLGVVRPILKSIEIKMESLEDSLRSAKGKAAVEKDVKVKAEIHQPFVPAISLAVSSTALGVQLGVIRPLLKTIDERIQSFENDKK
ncbi:hypothetical protein HK103_000685 [Boothiomyces macroporosus]|uniref:Uncharacterized protein n=1 Tax=Boothiomyces macroporosus TaxID=261099 RepID=A0AAD5UF34_9FUNG|nr:hypothetical protein HK103_000685 [Boothiomyces macroporosus]KAJ3309869.1 hypothetical protein HDV04_005571 [Boothiomyces sp. JEL0838]